MEIVFFNSKTKKFFKSLGNHVGPKAVKMFELLEQYGTDLAMPHSKSLGAGLFELRVMGTVQIRFIYTFHRHKIWVLHAFIKKTDRIPKTDISYARKQLKVLAST